MSFDLIIRQGRVVDGTGAPERRADVAVEGDRIAALGDLSAAQAAREIDGTGCVVAPGFIDAHAHSDAYLLIEPDAPSKLAQGVTTEVNGQCGGSAVPRLGQARLSSDWASQTYPLLASGEVQSGVRPGPTWTTVADYRALFEAVCPAVNAVQFIGHNTLRAGVMGYEPRLATPDEVGEMRRRLEQALEEGGWGLSTGLLYQPGKYAGEDEVVALARAAAAKGGIYATHMRSEGDCLLESVGDVLRLARAAGIQVQVSHLKTSGPANWHKVDAVLELLNRARAEGVRVQADRYPYTAAGTDLDVVLPDWASAGGRDAILANLRDPAARGRIAQVGQDRVAASRGSPVGQHHVQVRSGRRVRIPVRLHADAFGARPVEQLQHRVDLVPVGRSGRLQVRNLHLDAGRAREPQDIAHRLQQTVAFAAHVRGIDPALGRGCAGQRHHLVLARVFAGLIQQAGRQPPAALLQRLLQPPPHLAHLIRRGQPGLIAHNPGAQGVVADELHGVDRRAHRLEQRAVIRHRGPRRPRTDAALHLARGQKRVGLRGPVRGKPGLSQTRNRGAAALAVDFGGDALRELAGRVGFDQQIGVRVRVRVDEARRNHAPGPVDLPCGLRGGEVAQRRDAVSLDGHVGAPLRRARAIHHAALTYDQIEAHARSNPGRFPASRFQPRRPTCASR